MITKSAKVLLMNHHINGNPPIPTAETPYVGVRSYIPCHGGIDSGFYPFIYTSCMPDATYRDYWLSIPFDNADFVGFPEKRYVKNIDTSKTPFSSSADTSQCKVLYSDTASAWGGKISLTKSNTQKPFGESWTNPISRYGKANEFFCKSIDVVQNYSEGKLKTIYTGYWEGSSRDEIEANYIELYKTLMAPNFYKDRDNVWNPGSFAYFTEAQVKLMFEIDSGQRSYDYTNFDYSHSQCCKSTVLIASQENLNKPTLGQDFVASLEIDI